MGDPENEDRGGEVEDALGERDPASDVTLIDQPEPVTKKIEPVHREDAEGLTADMAMDRTLDASVGSLSAPGDATISGETVDDMADLRARSPETLPYGQDMDAPLEEDLGDRILRRMSEAKTEDDIIGRVIANRFEVLSKIGEGGMGAVYRASQRGMDRQVAIKVLLRDLARSDTVVKRFHLEALAISKLRHPHTIQIFDFGETDDGLLYIAMEFLEGVSLHGRIADEEELSTFHALHIIQQVAESLREAHGKGIVHRDLKPDNVFLTTLGQDQNYVKVLDFGVAKLRDTDQKSDALTKTGTITGTPRYMSPEQARGDSVDGRSDLYSLGVLLYQMLVGLVPFDGDNHVEILIKHIREDPRGLSQIRPDLVIPAEVEDLVMRLLAKNQEDRPHSTEVVIREIEEMLNVLDPLFRKVVTREDAIKIGLEIALSPSTRHDTRVSVSGVAGQPTMGPHFDETLGTAPALVEPRSPMTKWFIIAVTSVLVAIAGLVWAVEPLPARFIRFGSMESVDQQVSPLREIAAKEVVLTVASDPAGAQIFEADKLVGKTPFVRRSPRGAPSVELTFRSKGFEEVIRSYDFDADGTFTVKLPRIVPPPAPKSTKKPDKPKADPYDFEPGRVKSTKDSPY